jgi:hypothetical protein
MSDDFFDKVDKTLSDQGAAVKSANAAKDANVDFAKTALTAMRPVAEEYKRKLVERGIYVELTAGDSGLTFKMRYANGGHNGISVYPDIDTGRLQFRSHYTNDDGRPMVGIDANSYNASNWKDGVFKEKLEKLIKDFLTYAPRHGGARTS